LAQAALKFSDAARLPKGARATIVHARQDQVVPFEHSQRLLAGTDPSLVELIACDDNHALSGLLAGGRLPALVARACQAAVPQERWPD
jgi:predicted alpha/beta hydrolase family esterase